MYSVFCDILFGIRLPHRPFSASQSKNTVCDMLYVTKIPFWDFCMKRYYKLCPINCWKPFFTNNVNKCILCQNSIWQSKNAVCAKCINSTVTILRSLKDFNKDYKIISLNIHWLLIDTQPDSHYIRYMAASVLKSTTLSTPEGHWLTCAW